MGVFVVLTYEGKTDRLVCCGGGVREVMMMGRTTTTMPALENREEINLLPTTCTYLLALAPANKPRENGIQHFIIFSTTSWNKCSTCVCDSEVKRKEKHQYILFVPWMEMGKPCLVHKRRKRQ